MRIGPSSRTNANTVSAANPARKAGLATRTQDMNLVLNSCASLPDLTAEQSSAFGGKSRLRYLTRKLNFSVADDSPAVEMQAPQVRVAGNKSLWLT